MSENTPASHHIFVFPFKWDYLAPGVSISDASFSERTRLDQIDEIMSRFPQWSASPFKIALDHDDRYHGFNEYSYFLAYARDALSIDLSEQGTAHRFRYELPQKQPAYYEITTKTHQSAGPEYQLRIKDILLSWYDTGIGFLAFFLENHQTDDPVDVLRINDFGRRIYPQFLAYPQEATEAEEEIKAIDGPQWSFLAKKIRLVNVARKDIEENFEYYNSLENVNGSPIRLPNHISELLERKNEQGETMECKFSAAGRESAQRRPESHVLLTPVIDDRMFVLSYYFHEPSMARLKQYDSKKRQYAYVKDAFWHAYVFVDASLDITCQSRPMLEQLLEKHTYDRWIERFSKDGKPEGQLYGISRYSFMMLVDPCWFSKNILINHHKFLYFQMTTLALIQRSSIIRFAEEAARIAKLIDQGKKVLAHKKLIQEVYTAYMHFTNKVYFREITPQEQGIELYDKIREIMEIDSDLGALQREIEELHRYAMLVEGEKSGREAELLTWIATIFLPPSLLAALFGFSNFPAEQNFWSSLLIWLGLSAMTVLIIVLIVQIQRGFRKIRR